jgi:hypothetical protein
MSEMNREIRPKQNATPNDSGTSGTRHKWNKTPEMPWTCELCGFYTANLRHINNGFCRHDWAERVNLKCCVRCGIVANKANLDKPCIGTVKIEVRDDPSGTLPMGGQHSSETYSGNTVGMMQVIGPHYCIYCDFIDPTIVGADLINHFNDKHRDAVYAGLLKPIERPHSYYHREYSANCHECVKSELRIENAALRAKLEKAEALLRDTMNGLAFRPIKNEIREYLDKEGAK